MQDTAPYLDLDDPAFSIGSAEVMAAREAGWWARTPYGVAVLRYEEVRRLLTDRRLGQGSRRWPEHNGIEGPFADWWRRTLLNIDDESHARQRRALNPAFAGRVAEAMAPGFRALAEELVDGFAERGRCEFVSEFADPFVVRVVCRLLGAEEAAWRELGHWTAEIGLALSVTVRDRIDEVEHGLAQLTAYGDALIARRRAAPRIDDGLAVMLDAAADGRLTEEELSETVVHMFFGAVETTRNQLGLLLDLFLRHPAQWELLRERPELAPAAVEESMRLRPTTTWVTREALEDVEFEGLLIPQGTTVHLLSAVAGSDPLVFGEDAGFDIAAERPPHFAFGAGRHHCIGHRIARRDMAEALSVLSRRLRDLRPDGPGDWLPDSGNTGPVRLPIRFAAVG